MKTTYGTILVLVMAAVMLFTALPCGAVEKDEESIWREGERGRKRRQLELTDERIERIMERLAEADPDEAKRLGKLREEDPEKFKAELRKVMHERLGRKLREQRGQRASRGHQPPQDMPFTGRGGGRGGFGMGPGGTPGEGRRGMMRERMRERHDEYLEWLEKDYPEEAEELAKVREKKPELYMRRIGLSLKKYGRIAEAAKENPELAKALKENLELKERRDKLLRKIRAASSENEKKELIAQLEEVVSSRFDLIIKLKQIAYERLRKELEELKERVKQSEAEVEKWKDVKDEKVKERLEKLISRTEELNWD